MVQIIWEDESGEIKYDEGTNYTSHLALGFLLMGFIQLYNVIY